MVTNVRRSAEEQRGYVMLTVLQRRFSAKRK